MIEIDRAPNLLVLRSGGTSVTLDKKAATATFARKGFLFSKKPVTAPLSDVSDATVDAAVDRASGVEVCHTMVLLATGSGWAVPADDKRDAEKGAQAVKEFLKG